MDTKNTIAALMSSFAQALSNMSNEDFNSLLSGKGRLYFKSDKAYENNNENILENDLKQIVNQLLQFESRELAIQFLENNDLVRLKEQLLNLAAVLNVYINKNASKPIIIKKIVDSTVGSMIASKAIKETNLEGPRHLYRKEAQKKDL
jgi:ribosome-interacting GTPase 1